MVATVTPAPVTEAATTETAVAMEAVPAEAMTAEAVPSATADQDEIGTRIGAAREGGLTDLANGRNRRCRCVSGHPESAHRNYDGGERPSLRTFHCTSPELLACMRPACRLLADDRKGPHAVNRVTTRCGEPRRS